MTKLKEKIIALEIAIESLKLNEVALSEYPIQILQNEIDILSAVEKNRDKREFKN